MQLKAPNKFVSILQRAGQQIRQQLDDAQSEANVDAAVSRRRSREQQMIDNEHTVCCSCMSHIRVR